MTIDVNIIVQSFCAASFIASVAWVVTKIQAMTTQMAVLAEQVKDMRVQIISREVLEREIGALNARCDKMEKDIDRNGHDFRRVAAEHDACAHCGK